MLPDNRLAALLQQVKQSQINTCLYHTSAASPSLYSDHRCDRANFPSEVAVTLTDIDGEVWQVQFSHSGDLLAASGSGPGVAIWHVPDFGVATILSHDKAAVGNLSWSPDDSHLVTCSRDNCARIWDTKVGCPPPPPKRVFYRPVSRSDTDRSRRGRSWCILAASKTL